jgi:hypothetical protein
MRMPRPPQNNTTFMVVIRRDQDIRLSCDWMLTARDLDASLPARQAKNVPGSLLVSVTKSCLKLRTIESVDRRRTQDYTVRQHKVTWAEDNFVTDWTALPPRREKADEMPRRWRLGQFDVPGWELAWQIHARRPSPAPLRTSPQQLFSLHLWILECCSLKPS